MGTVKGTSWQDMPRIKEVNTQPHSVYIGA
jgi:hypothetical protein